MCGFREVWRKAGICVVLGREGRKQVHVWLHETGTFVVLGREGDRYMCGFREGGRQVHVWLTEGRKEDRCG